MITVSPEVKKAFELACNVQKNAYAPYSNFQVGAAFKLKNRDEYTVGCNVENASFGATVCAERGAVQTSIGKLGGKPDFEFLVVVTNTDPCIGPCALCLQVLSEFVGPDFPIYLGNPKGIQTQVKFSDLLGKPFSTIPDQIES